MNTDEKIDSTSEIGDFFEIIEKDGYELLLIDIIFAKHPFFCDWLL